MFNYINSLFYITKILLKLLHPTTSRALHQRLVHLNEIAEELDKYWSRREESDDLHSKCDNLLEDEIDLRLELGNVISDLG